MCGNIFCTMGNWSRSPSLAIKNLRQQKHSQLKYGLCFLLQGSSAAKHQLPFAFAVIVFGCGQSPSSGAGEALLVCYAYPKGLPHLHIFPPPAYGDPKSISAQKGVTDIFLPPCGWVHRLRTTGCVSAPDALKATLLPR